ncbi:DNA excision repair protein [Morchella snyderi]|nr:DNA excision repair protein [Morchella snyderi]
MSSDGDDDLDHDISYSFSFPKELKSAQGNGKGTGTANLAPAFSDDDDDDDDDLGYVPVPRRKPASVPAPSRPVAPPQRVSPDPLSEEEEEDEEEEEEIAATPPIIEEVRTVKHEHGKGDRVLWSEGEEDTGYEEWNRKRKEAAGGRKRKASAVSTGEKKVRVDRKEASGRKGSGAGTAARKASGTNGGVSSHQRSHLTTANADTPDPSLSEIKLPQHLLARRRILDHAAASLDSTAPHPALRLPPDSSDLFNDAENTTLATKPAFKTTPSAPYADISLPTSLGVIPAPIAQYLRSYQVAGAAFLHRNFVFQTGCILGDDMGLGKTVQVIAFLTAAFGKTADERDRKRMRKMRRAERWYPRVLVICPGTLIANWRSELETWGWWAVEVFHGNKEQRTAAAETARSGMCEIMITTSTTYKIHRDEVNRVEWDCVIVDECHVIKERKSLVTQDLNQINALCRIGLTGTAIQNKYEELWTLLNWCRPGAVSTISEWKSTICAPLKIGQSHDATLRQIGVAREVARLLVNNLLPKLFLRRMKSLIADQLPKKSDRVVFCPLTARQKVAYENFLESEVVVGIRRSGERCKCGSGAKRGACCFARVPDGRRWKDAVFPCIQRIQQLSNHLANWVPTNEDPTDKRKAKLELLKLCLPDEWEMISRREQLPNYMDPEMCGKWIVLRKLLKFWRGNQDKVLIFSYSIPLLKILFKLFETTEYNVSYLDGSMPLEDRAKAVYKFNDDPEQFVFLISTRAGGVGLNITAANKVVIFDPNWNPSYDLQAQDRAYRIGQTRDVEVFRLISAGTIEEIVYARQIYKQQQANIGYGASEERRYFSGVQGDKTNKGELFGLQNLFSFQENTILKEIVNKTNVAESKAGVAVAGLELDDWEDEEEFEEDVNGENALNQLAAIVAGEKSALENKKKAQNPVSAILAEAGISYTHENSEVIGTSKVEAQISKRAARASKDADMGDRVVFDSTETRGNGLLKGYKFHPPADVMRRQFCTMAKMFGIEDVGEFALLVESWTQQQRRDALDKFYKMRRDTLEKGEEVKLEDVQPEEVLLGETAQDTVYIEIMDDDDDEL